ncbi:MAG: DNA polymerase I [Planctomycetes bacterium]|nr:DNA polymerase I [Planctomycetota bacterium]
MARLFLLDGTALAYRSHFAIPNLTSPTGKPSGATYGFTMTLRRILENEKPDLIAVAFDPPGPTHRHHRYAEYKATRERAPEEMIAQLDWMRSIVRAHGIPLFEVKGFEADDVIGTLTVQARALGHDVLIVTGDKDFMQLVGPSVKLYNVFKKDIDVLIEAEEAVTAKFGTTPDHVVDVLAIMGDASDNVPGVKGIGEKGATKLIAEFGSVDGVLANLDKVKGKARELIERDREQLLMSRELVTIDTHVPLDPGFEAIRPPDPDAAQLRELFTQFGFLSLLKKLDSPKTASTEVRDYRIVRTEAELDELIALLRNARRFAVDTETTSLFPLQAELVGASFSCNAGVAWYVPFNLDPPLCGSREALLEKLRPILEDPTLEHVGQNTKYDMLVFIGHGVRPPPPEFDTMVASYCIAGAARRHNLDDLALHYFGLTKIPTSDLIGRGAKQITMAQVPVDKVGEYACEDADVTWRLGEVLAKELVEASAERLFRDLEMPLVPVLTAMEERGIRVDTELLAKLGLELEIERAEQEKRVHELAGGPVNLHSPKALGEVLFEKLKIHEAAGVKRPKRTQTGYATDYETLSTNYADVPIVQALLEHREVSKLQSTYVEALPRFVNPRTGRIHCSFSQVTAATGRLASSDPNLQNIPIRTERGRKLRGAFVAREKDSAGEWCLLTADYSQVELRIMAHLTGDRFLCEAFARGEDIHASTASVIFDVMPGMVTRDMRSRAKAVNFGLLYGMGPARLARDTGLTMIEARQFIERYFKKFPKVREWRENLLAEARKTGYVQTLFGRRRATPELTSEEARTRVFAENAAVNTPVQGTAADIIKRAMIDLEATLAQSKLLARMLLQVHDELVLELPTRELDEATEIVRHSMEGAAKLDVPLKVDFGHGRSWLEAH